MKVLGWRVRVTHDSMAPDETPGAMLDPRVGAKPGSGSRAIVVGVHAAIICRSCGACAWHQGDNHMYVVPRHWYWYWLHGTLVCIYASACNA